MGFFAFFKNVFFPPPVVVVVVDPVPKEYYQRTPGYVEFDKEISPSDLAGINAQQKRRNKAFEEFAQAVKACLVFFPDCWVFDIEIRKSEDNVSFVQPNYGDYLLYLSGTKESYYGLLTHYHMDQFVPAEAAKQLISVAKWEVNYDINRGYYSRSA